ncbi:phosphoglycolate phosphatase [Thiobacter aerophilum]|uniref:phosphoglycolate phosphatase n=1 Tax=Thiobacter aerophilum TaxID=3121275 RepID=A0ABV0EBV2_9BURK
MLVEAVLFDLDGTLADTARDLAFALNEQRRLHGLPPLPFEAIRPVASHGARGLLALGFDLRPDTPEFAAMRSEFLELYGRHLCDQTVLFPGMEETLAALERRGLRWGVVTNKPARFTLPLLHALGLASRAACIVSGDTTANAKPHPEPLLEAARQLVLPSRNCLYVGDAQRDVAAARAAGMPALVARYGYLAAEDEPTAWGALGLIDTPADLLHWLA